jgi:hypothetical protein
MKEMETDEPYMHNEALPVWIVTISGWGSESMEEAHQRMDAYKAVAEKWKINIEFSSRLGTFRSYKRAPSVSKEISAHNDQTFTVCEKLFGENWRNAFVEEVHKRLSDRTK